jgi:hypothetical protein
VVDMVANKEVVADMVANKEVDINNADTKTIRKLGLDKSSNLNHFFFIFKQLFFHIHLFPH